MTSRLETFWALVGTALALGGLACSGYLLEVHRTAQLGDPSALCVDGEFWTCQAAVESTYSLLFGLPVAAWSAGYQVVTLVLWWAFERRRNAGPLVWLGLAGVLFSAYLAGISVLILKRFCPACTVLYVIIALQLVAALGLLRTSDRAPGRFLGEGWCRRAIGLAAALGLVALLASAGYVGP